MNRPPMFNPLMQPGTQRPGLPQAHLLPSPNGVSPLLQRPALGPMPTGLPGFGPTQASGGPGVHQQAAGLLSGPLLPSPAMQQQQQSNGRPPIGPGGMSFANRLPPGIPQNATLPMGHPPHMMPNQVNSSIGVGANGPRMPLQPLPMGGLMSRLPVPPHHLLPPGQAPPGRLPPPHHLLPLPGAGPSQKINHLLPSPHNLVPGQAMLGKPLIAGSNNIFNETSSNAEAMSDNETSEDSQTDPHEQSEAAIDQQTAGAVTSSETEETNTGTQIANQPPINEVWIETQAGGGKVYYYNSRTRETTWTKPEDCVILTHEQFAQQQASLINKTVACATASNGDLVANQTILNPLTNNNQSQPVAKAETILLKPKVPLLTQKPGVTMPLVQPAHTTVASVNTPAPTITSHLPPAISMHPSNVSTMHPPPIGIHQMQVMQMPPKIPAPFPAAGAFTPMTGHFPPSFGPSMNIMFPPPAINPQKLLMVPVEIRTAASEWIEYKTPESKPYYFSNKTQQSVWEKPKALIDFEEAMKKINDDEIKVQKAIQNHISEQQAGKKEKPVDKSKPVSSTPIAGTPWCIVRTGDDRHFFYNPSKKTSVWQKPKELESVPNIDDLIASCTASSDTSAVGTKADNNASYTTQAGAVTAKPEAELIDLEKEEENTQDEESNRIFNNLKATNNHQNNKSDASGSTDKQSSDVDLKRLTASDESSAAKKQKIDDEESRKQMGITSVEALATKQRLSTPLEERIKLFTEMLEEKEVSAFSTWEKELHKIVFDPRYLLLTSKERKQTFDQYVSERADKERKEKESRNKKNRQEFRAFVRNRLKTDLPLSLRMSFSDFLSRNSEQEEMKLIERNRDREQIFVDVISELKKREKDKAKERFMDLLQENVRCIDKYTKFSDIRDNLRDDPRYRDLEISVREELFRQFIAQLHSNSSKTKKHKDDRRSPRYRKDRSRSRSAERNETKNGISKKRTISKLSEPDEGEIQSDDEPGQIEDEDDDDFKLEKDVLASEKWSKANTHEKPPLTEAEQKELDKQRRIEKSLRERERQVQKELEGHLMDRDRQRIMYKQQELVENFNILLIDLIRNSDLSWREAKKILKKDHRYVTIAEQLSRTERENLFEQHANNLLKKRRKFFVELLEEEGKHIKLNSQWRDVRKLFKDDPRYQQFSEKRAEKEFAHFLKDRLNRAKADFRTLLKETKLITYKSRQLIESTDQQHLADIITHLQNDRRYLDLDVIEDERRQLLIDYIEEIAAKGPPPPPTAFDHRKKAL